MRQAVMRAGHHVAHRSAFGALLIDKPAMQMVIADLEVEVQAATALMTRLARSFDPAGDDETEAAIQRILTPVAKYRVTKGCRPVVRVAAKEPEALSALRGELDSARGKDSAYDRYLDETWDLVEHPHEAEAQARRMTERLEIASQAALLMDRANDEVAAMCLSSRVAGDHEALFGTQAPTGDVGKVERMALPST